MIRHLSAAIVAACCLGGAVRATVTVPTEFREIVGDAHVIVRGHVTDVRSVTLDQRRIETVATVAVDTALKGTSDAFVYVHVPGGQVGRLRVTAVDAPTFSTGDQAVFFLRRGTDNFLRPVGLSLGVYRVATDSRTGQTAITPPLLAGQTAAPGAVVHGDPLRRSLTVDEFQSLVRLVLATQGGAGTAARR